MIRVIPSVSYIRKTYTLALWLYKVIPGGEGYARKCVATYRRPQGNSAATLVKKSEVPDVIALMTSQEERERKREKFREKKRNQDYEENIALLQVVDEVEEEEEEPSEFQEGIESF